MPRPHKDIWGNLEDLRVVPTVSSRESYCEMQMSRAFPRQALDQWQSQPFCLTSHRLLLVQGQGYPMCLRGPSQAQSVIYLCRTVAPAMLEEPVRRACPLGCLSTVGDKEPCQPVQATLDLPQGTGVRKEGEAVTM